MSTLARTTEINCDTRAANEDCINGGSRTRTKYAYDSNGNTTSGDGVKTYKYDAENRLIEIDYVGGSNKTVFTYDGVGHRITQAETVSGTTTTTRNLWCGSRICQTRTSADVVTRRHYLEGEQNVTTGQKLVYMPDQLGSVRDIVDAATSGLVGSYDYTPYGAIARSSGTIGTDYRYAKLFYHPASSLNLSTTRAFDGATGRWLNRDSIRERGGLNLYEYANSDPTLFVDPSGRFGLPGFFIGIGAGGVAGYYSGGIWGGIVGAGVGGGVGIFAPWLAPQVGALTGSAVAGAFAFASTVSLGAGAATIITNIANELPDWSDDLGRNMGIAFAVPLAFSMEAWGVVGIGTEESFNAEFAKNFLSIVSTGWGLTLDMVTRKPSTPHSRPSRGNDCGDPSLPRFSLPA